MVSKQASTLLVSLFSTFKLSYQGIIAFVFKKYFMRNSNENLVDFGGLINGIFAGFIAITASNNCVETWAALLLDLSEE